MYIIFSKNNSIIESQLNDYINKGSDGVNFLDIVLYDNLNDRYCSPDEYTLTGAFLLPDGSTSLNATGVLNNSITTSLGTFEGYRFYFYEAFTQQSGDLKFSVVASFTDKTYVSHTQIFNVNDSAIYKNSTITWEEYENLMKTIADYQLQYSSTNVRGYASYDKAKEDLANLATSQKVLVRTENGAEVYNVKTTATDTGTSKELHLLPVAVEANRPYFVYTKGNYSPKGETQYVDTGLCVDFVNSDDTSVKYGTNPSEFYAYVLDASGNYSGAISLGAKVYEFNNAQGVKFLEMDDSATYLRSYNGTTEIKMASGETTIQGNKLTIRNSDNELVTFGDNVAKFNADIEASIALISQGMFTYAEVEKEPDIGTSVTNKSYVDKTAEAQATEKANIEKQRAEYYEGYLQDQVDAINKSQNFVATFATHQDLVNIDMSKLDYSDCVLILKDEDHNDQSTVYRYKGGSGGVLDMFEFVGELGDYYTKAQINTMHTEMETTCKAYSDTASANAVKAVFTATSSKTAESE